MEIRKNLPYLLTREEASEFLGISVVTFDRYFRSNENFPRFTIGKSERYTIESIINYIKSKEC